MYIDIISQVKGTILEITNKTYQPLSREREKIKFTNIRSAKGNNSTVSAGFKKIIKLKL